MKLTDEILAGLKRDGHRITNIRASMVHVFASQTSPLTADDIRRLVTVSSPDVNKTTIYREIAFLEQAGIVRKIEFGDQVRRYELDGEHHHHAICTDCGKVEDVILQEDLDAPAKTLKQKSGFRVTGHSLEFFGLCSSCV